MTKRATPHEPRGGPGADTRAGGFTLIEIITVIIILGILAVVMFPRSGTLGGAERARLAEVRAQIRYVQLKAMKSGSVLGITCAGTNYWAFAHNATDPTSSAAPLALPGETANIIDMSAATGKNMTMTAFTYFFDSFGIPYTAYSSASVNTKLAAPATITITAGGGTGTLTLTPETGYVP